MFKFILIIAVICFSVWFGLYITHDPGYILISYNNLTIETSVWFGVLALLFSFFLVLAINQIVIHINNGASWVKLWRTRRNAYHGNIASESGFKALLQHDFASAERYFQTAANYNVMPEVHYLFAAIAGSKANTPEQVDMYLSAAQRITDTPVMTELTAAKLNIEHHAGEAAEELLEALLVDFPNQKGVLQTYYQALEQRKEYDKLVAILPKLLKFKIIEPDAAVTIERAHALTKLAHLREVHASEQDWQDYFDNLPKALQADAQVLLASLPERNQYTNSKKTNQLFQQALSSKWDVALIEAYAQVDHDPKQQLEFCDKQMKQHPECPGLLLCQGRLCVQLQLWGKALQFYHAAIDRKPSAHAYFELAKLCNEQNQQAESRNYFEKGLAYAVAQAPMG